MPRCSVGGNLDVARGYAQSGAIAARELTVLTGQSGITLVKVVPVGAATVALE
jgi:hypothetical protein